MGASVQFKRVLRFAGAGATAVLLSLGTAGVAGAEDQHSGGQTPNNGGSDPGSRVLGETLRRPQSSSGHAPTGADVLGLAAIGAGAIAVGSTVVISSRRRAANTPA